MKINNSFSVWWSMIKAHRECADLEPLKDDDVILHFMGSGASTMVTVKDIEDVIAALEHLKELQNDK